MDDAMEMVTSPVDPVIVTLKLVESDAPGYFLIFETPVYPAKFVAEPSDSVEVKSSLNVVP